MGPDYFWDASPNLDGDHGLTIPRLKRLVDEYAALRKRELAEQGAALVLAITNPEALMKLGSEKREPARSGWAPVTSGTPGA